MIKACAEPAVSHCPTIASKYLTFSCHALVSRQKQILQESVFFYERVQQSIEAFQVHVLVKGQVQKNGPRQFLQWKNEGSEYIMCLGLETYNMFNCDKVKNNEIQGNLFFTPMSRSGAFFLHLPHGNFFGSEGIKMITHYIMVKIPFI